RRRHRAVQNARRWRRINPDTLHPGRLLQEEEYLPRSESSTICSRWRHEARLPVFLVLAVILTARQATTTYKPGFRRGVARLRSGGCERPVTCDLRAGEAQPRSKRRPGLRDGLRPLCQATALNRLLPRLCQWPALFLASWSRGDHLRSPAR